MAKIVTEHVVIEISRVAKDTEQLDTLLTDELASTLEEVAQQLIGDSAVVEVKGGGTNG